MTEVGKRPTKPGQMVMIVGIEPTWFNHRDNGLIGITVKQLTANERRLLNLAAGLHLMVSNDGWLLMDCTRPTSAAKAGGPCTAPDKNLIVIADPDIDVSETESLGVSNGATA